MDQELSIMEEEINTSVPLPDSDLVEPEVPVSPGEENATDMVVNMVESTNDVDDENIGVIVDVENGSGGGGEFKERRKRGRPRKDAEDLGHQELVLTPEYLATQQKRGRGRPRGTGKWQTLAASFGGMAVSAAAGSNFTPYTMIIPTGENIAQRIWSVSQSQRASDSICVLSASGAVSIAEILQPGPLGATVKYEGRFDIVSLCGSHIYTERGLGGRRVARLSIQLANPDGRIFGGVVGGWLIAAVPTQLVVATFRQNTKELPKARPISRSVAVATSVPTAPPNAVIGNVITEPEENHASPSAVHENSPQSCPGS
ncbi:AT-hook motif nuclear-localized protein 11-like [Primulina huaijiensis]|uniref:AT-hook motif nuclear-localized protein 11-like n=1 Tax=Primulina huaijiensis TaxID=1492673 RepID=UPI003CC72D3A